MQMVFTVAGGSPAASHFCCFAKKSNQKKAIPGLPPLRGSRVKSQSCGAAELARSATQPRAQTVLAQPHRMIAIFSAVHRGRYVNNKSTSKPQAVCAQRTPKSKKQKTCGLCPHSYFDFEAAFDCCFWVPLIHHRVAQTGQGMEVTTRRGATCCGGD